MPRDTTIKKISPIDIGDRIGVSFGVTLNMGEYQSLRVESWAESTKREGETSAEAYKRLFDVVEREANKRAGEYKKP
jgi:hypothetical protein